MTSRPQVILCNTEAEQAVLGGVFLRPAILNDLRLTAEDFHSPAHRSIYAAMLAVLKSRKPVDLLTVADELKRRGDFDKAGAHAYLAELAGNIVTASNAAYHAEIIREFALRRRAIEVAGQIQDSASSTQEPLSTMIEQTTQALASIGDAMSSTDVAEAYDVSLDVLQQVRERMANRGGMSGVPTGFDDLDRMTNGLQPSDLIIVAGRPSMGKTAFALNLAFRSADRGYPAGVFSLEMSKEALVSRQLCTMAQVDTSKLRSGYLSEQDMDKLVDVAEKIKTAPVYIDETGGIRMLELKAKARRMVRQNGVRLIIVDYVGLVRCDAKKDSREQEVAYVSSELKALAKELRVPVIALSQLNRKVEERKEKRPTLSDLRDSGSLEQDADVIMFLYNDTYYKNGNVHPTNKPTETEIIIAKHRNGSCGTVGLAFFAQHVRFENQAVGGW